MWNPKIYEAHKESGGKRDLLGYEGVQPRPKGGSKHEKRAVKIPVYLKTLEIISGTKGKGNFKRVGEKGSPRGDKMLPGKEEKVWLKKGKEKRRNVMAWNNGLTLN